MQKTLSTEQHGRLVNLLINARQNAGLTQAQLADIIGEYQSFVARLESGQRRIDVIELIAICGAVGIDTGDIIEQLTGTKD